MKGVKLYKMKMGDAILQLNRLQNRKNAAVATREEESEYRLILDALNKADPIEIFFDCDGDGVADTIEIFQQTSATSCCRLMDAKPDTSRRKKTSSRRRAP